MTTERYIEFCIDNGAGEILRYHYAAVQQTDAQVLGALRASLEKHPLKATSLADALMEVSGDALADNGLRRVVQVDYDEIDLGQNTVADFLEGEDVADLRAQLLAMSQGFKK